MILKGVIRMTQDDVQNSRIRDLENRVNQVENDLASILTELTNIKTLAKGLFMLASIALGVDIVPMLEA
tara:strand:+ start:8893 stop:9099 length:207 start_codon:yes stop_codon:yes gene_type:complete